MGEELTPLYLDRCQVLDGNEGALTSFITPETSPVLHLYPQCSIQLWCPFRFPTYQVAIDLVVWSHGN